MATGGAWESETFDNGSDFHKSRAPHHATQAPPMQGSSTPPAMYNPSPIGTSKDSSAFGVIALILRIAQIVLTILAFAIMAANKETIYSSYLDSYYGTYLTSSTYNFASIKAFIGVLALNCIVCFYAIVQVVQSFVNMSSKGSFISSPTTGFAMLTFVFDTVLAYALIAASAAGADSAAILGDGGCGALDKFCQKAQASVAMSFLAFVVLAASAALYPVRLLRLTKG